MGGGGLGESRQIMWNIYITDVQVSDLNTCFKMIELLGAWFLESHEAAVRTGIYGLAVFFLFFLYKISTEHVINQLTAGPKLLGTN